MTIDRDALNQTLESARNLLMSEMTDAGFWEGQLSSSALATAVASFALWTAGERETARVGMAWLARNVNEDGGWGDTIDSPSNLTTTLLGWCALSVTDENVDGAESWLRNRIGSLDPDRIVEAILTDYGNDRTFSAPILTMCTLVGKTPWARVPQLPFELAALPHAFFRWLRLPVVSYAMPALIAIGLVRHRLGPRGLNPVRGMCTKKVLNVLKTIQPESGGFLEAAPLTSFVTMSMIAAGYRSHEATVKCIEFLKTNMRDDGGWPVVPNLATWLTSLSARTLHASDAAGVPYDRIQTYLIDGQMKDVHPFTQAKPGAWTWTHCSGGVPDGDDTAAALIALRRTGEIDDRMRTAAENGIGWLIDLQNRDGGIPTFCKGWGRLPFDRSCPDITAHTLAAFSEWQNDVSPKLRSRIQTSSKKAIRYLVDAQGADGAWIPLWFGSQHVTSHHNKTYGTSRVLDVIKRLPPETTRKMVENGRKWLSNAQNSDGGWGGDKNAPSTIEETALATHALAGIADETTVNRGIKWLIKKTESGTKFPAEPIGLYFARLWYSEKLYPIIFTIDALASCVGRSHS